MILSIYHHVSEFLVASVWLFGKRRRIEEYSMRINTRIYPCKIQITLFIQNQYPHYPHCKAS